MKPSTPIEFLVSSLSTASDATVRRRLDRILATIPHEGNRAIVARYIRERRANGVKGSTLANDATALRGFCLHMGEKSLEDAERDDVIAYVSDPVHERAWASRRRDGGETVTRRETRLSSSTMSVRKAILRAFFKWHRGTDDYPVEVRGIRVGRTTEDSIPTDQLLTSDDLRRLLQAHPDARDKALLAVLYDSGLRAGELCALNVGGVQFDEYGAILTLPKGARGLKTGARRVRLHESVPYLHAWFETHPRKDDPRAALFYSMSRRAPGARMTPNALWQFCRRAAEKADLKKELHPHGFRHAAATERARMGWTEAMMRGFFGWSRSSDMPARYVHLAGQDYEQMDLERRGLLKPGQHARRALAALVCRVCKAANLPTAMFCQGCRHPVSPAAEAELERRREEELNRVIASEVRRLMEQRGTRPA